MDSREGARVVGGTETHEQIITVTQTRPGGERQAVVVGPRGGSESEPLQT